MAKLEELEERLDRLEMGQRSDIVKIDKVHSTTIRFYCSSYYADIDIVCMSNTNANIELVLNGVTKVYNTNFVSERFEVKADNVLTIKVASEGLLSKRVRIEGIGVRLQSV